jgi:hypothetical protein
MNYHNLQELIRQMLEDVDSSAAVKLRKDFHDKPHDVMKNHRLEKHEQTLLFTMDRTLIKEQMSDEVKQMIHNYTMEADWSEKGKDWPAPGPGEGWIEVPQDAVAVAGDGSASPAPITGSETRGGWGDPGPHGRGFRPETVPLGQERDLTLVGEGFLGTAKITIQNGNYLLQIPVKEINFRNFRRTYLRTEKFRIDKSWPAGDYEVKVQNDPTYDALPAGHFLNVT